MVLAFEARFSTEDVDASYVPPEDVARVADEVGLRRGLREGWLNDAAKIFVPAFREPDWRPVVRVGGVEVVAADAKSMLAMKLRAGRGKRDLGDVVFLLRRCRLSTSDGVLALYAQYLPEDPLTARGRAILDAAIERLAD